MLREQALRAGADAELLDEVDEWEKSVLVDRISPLSVFRAKKSEQDGGDNFKATLFEMTAQAGLARVVLEPVSRPTTPV